MVIVAIYGRLGRCWRPKTSWSAKNDHYGHFWSFMTDWVSPGGQRPGLVRHFDHKWPFMTDWVGPGGLRLVLAPKPSFFFLILKFFDFLSKNFENFQIFWRRKFENFKIFRRQKFFGRRRLFGAFLNNLLINL